MIRAAAVGSALSHRQARDGRALFLRQQDAAWPDACSDRDGVALAIAKLLLWLLAIVAFLLGAHFLDLSIKDRRAVDVADYDKSVDAWNVEARQAFDDLRLALAVSFGNRSGADAIAGADGYITSMNATISETRDFGSDAAAGAGLHDYTPLSYEAHLPFQPLPHGADPLSAPPMINLDISPFKWNGSDVARPNETLQLPSLPLYFFKPLSLRKGDDNNIRRGQISCGQKTRGIWLNNQCWEMNVLSEVCVQVSVHDAHWWLYSASSPSKPKRLNAKNETAHYGCDPATNWSPTVYKSCFAADAFSSRASLKLAENSRSLESSSCIDALSARNIIVTVRSWRDPYLSAESLTTDTFDFGLGQDSLRIIGFALLSMGSLMVLVLLLPVMCQCSSLEADELFEDAEMELSRPLSASANMSVLPSPRIPRRPFEPPTAGDVLSFQDRYVDAVSRERGPPPTRTLVPPARNAASETANALQAGEENGRALPPEFADDARWLEAVATARMLRAGQRREAAQAGNAVRAASVEEAESSAVTRGIENALRFSRLIDNATLTMLYSETSSGGGGAEQTCSICMEAYVDGEVLRTLPCLHRYHIHCVDQWLTNHTECPVCKHPITDR